MSSLEQLRARSQGYQPSKFAAHNRRTQGTTDLRATSASVRDPSVAPGRARADRGGVSPRGWREPPLNADLDCERSRWRAMYTSLDSHAADFEGAWLKNKTVRHACRNCLVEALLPYTTAYHSGAEGPNGWATPWRFCCPKCRADFLGRVQVEEAIRLKLQLMGIGGWYSHPVIPDAAEFQPAAVVGIPRP